jgi:hypothetical protein
MIRHHEQTAQAAQARLAEITRDAIPGSNPSWGVNRLRKELNDMGYRFKDPTDAPGVLYEHATNGAQVRIMERPPRVYRKDSPQKHYSDYYYRYRPGNDQQYGSHITIPDKD